MAIDLKNIIGQGKSTILTPAEIADLGLRRKQMRQQEERFEFSKDQQTIDNIFSNADSFTSQEQITGALNNLNTVDSNDDNINSFKAITMSKLQDNQAKLNTVKRLEEKFNTFDNIDRQLYEKPDVNADDLFDIINNYNKLAIELGNPEYANYLSPELQAKFAVKTDHYGMIGDALITGNDITEEEWKAISSGNRERYLEARKAATDSIDSQYAIAEKRYNSLNNVLTNFMQSQTKQEDIFTYGSTGPDGMDMTGVTTPQQFVNLLTEKIQGYEGNMRSISRRNEAWRGEKLYLEPEFVGDNLYADLDKDNIIDEGRNKGMPVYVVARPGQEATTQQTSQAEKPKAKDDDVSFLEGVSQDKDLRKLFGLGVGIGAANVAPDLMNVGKNYVKETAKAVRYLKSTLNVGDEKIAKILRDVANVNSSLSKELEKAEKIKYKPTRGVGEDPGVAKKKIKEGVERARKGIVKRIAKKYGISEIDAGRLIKSKGKYDIGRIIKMVSKSKDTMPVKLGSQWITGNFVRQAMDIDFDSNDTLLGKFGNVAADVTIGKGVQKTASRFYDQLVKVLGSKKGKQMLADKLGKAAAKRIIPSVVGGLGYLSLAAGLVGTGIAAKDIYQFIQEYKESEE